MDYSVLVTHIINNKVLLKAIQDLEERTHALNLITHEWRSRLENTHAYKTHTEGIATYFKKRACKNEMSSLEPLQFKNEKFPIIVVGEWYLSLNDKHEFSIVSRECEPLRVIGLSVQVNKQSKLHDGGRFFIKNCTPSFCHVCTESHLKYKVPFEEKNWCVKSLRVFDGNNIKNEFTKNLQENMLALGNFMGIMYIIIDRRITYGNNEYKVGGIIEELIVFQKSVLIPSNSLTFGSTFNVPSVEFPEESE